MEAPRVEGFKVRCLFATGGCGDVFLAEDASGGLVAVKVWHGMAIQDSLAARLSARLEEGGWPEGVMPVAFSDYKRRPALWVTPWMADGDPERLENMVPRTLQQRLGEFPGEASWPMVRALARALAAMHGRRVAHRNLKPGNVFFNETGEVLLTDWSLGTMPGVAGSDFSDALLYQPPEQLLNAASYAEETACRWDVFAFGVLAYRLLTGRFPRCHETFSAVAPAPGETRVDGVQAVLPRIAKQLSACPDVGWPEEAKNTLETGLRGWIERCLALEPLLRPATMLDVVAGFGAVEEKVATGHELERLMDQRRRADQMAWRVSLAAGLATATALVLGGLWQWTAFRWREESQDLKGQADAATQARETVEKNAAEVTRRLEHERDVALAPLEASRLVGDRLFSWAMEKGHRALPPLDGREQRLQQLERFFEDFLTRTAGVAALGEERARARLQLAEISLAQGDAQVATQRLGEALKAWEGLPMGAELRLRWAVDRLLLALLRQAGGDAAAEAAFVAARTALAEVPPAQVDADRLSQLTAILDFHEAKLIAARGGDAKASAQLMRATQTLNRLADQRPDSVVLRSELAACYLSSATILEGIGTLGDAREVRTLAMAELNRLLKKAPTDFPLRLELAGCYGAMAESAILAGDNAGAESLIKEATKLLVKLVREQPDNSEAVARMAAQLGLSAGLMRDRGQAAEALKAFDEGIRLLEGVRASAPTDASACYRLALLWWQKGRMLGTGGKRDEEIRLTTQARELLTQLEGECQPGGPLPEQIQRSVAYLLGDLGHALQMAKKKDEARAAFADAVTYWDALLKARPASAEYEEARAWCRQRGKELK
jgi:tetratricopeptide (TPR) repeat protein